MPFVTGVYLRDITNTNCPVLRLNVSHLSIFSSCYYVYVNDFVCNFCIVLS